MLDRSRDLVTAALAGLAGMLVIALVGLIIWRTIDELRYLRRQRVIGRYRSLVDPLLTPIPEPDALQRLIDSPRRDRSILADLILGALRLTTGNVVPRLREAAWAL